MCWDIYYKQNYLETVSYRFLYTNTYTSLFKASNFCTKFNTKVNHNVKQSSMEEIYTDIRASKYQKLRFKC